METKSTTLYLDDQRLTIRLPLELWRQLATYTINNKLSGNKKENGNTLMVRLLVQHFDTDDLIKIHSRLLLAKVDPESGQSANSIVTNLLTEYFKANPV